MNRLPRTRFDQLAAAARQERIPNIDVTDRVLDRLVRYPREPSADWVLMAAALCSVAVAVAIMILANQQGVLFTDSLAELIRPFAPVIQ